MLNVGILEAKPIEPFSPWQISETYDYAYSIVADDDVYNSGGVDSGIHIQVGVESQLL